jgi:hypothetical protein
MTLAWLIFACGPRVGDVPIQDTDSDVVLRESSFPTTRTIAVTVLLDGEAVDGAAVLQGGNTERWQTNAAGEVSVDADLTVDGDLFLMASHPAARIAGDYLPDDSDELTIELERFDPTDNEDFVFQDPGTPDHPSSSTACSHCHVSILEDWYESPHRTSASNPPVQDLYAGAAASWATQDQCEAANGTWMEGILPGTAAAGFRCYVGDGVLPALNDCEAPCDSTAAEYGACADCHAPGIDGVLGGRDLLEATGTAYDAGVHCDVCHHVESVVPDAPAGVAGRLHLVRPSEEADFPEGSFVPLTFGPYDDVPNPRMGSVVRDHFADSSLCSGCHELEQAALVAGLDTQRWPNEKLPVHTTYSEWEASGFGPCQGCHMPPDTEVGNSADLDNLFAIDPGVAGGWRREPGEVHQHAWFGPRRPEAGLLESAANLAMTKQVVGDELIVTVTVANSGAGHALPTGEPMRSVLLSVRAHCGTTPVPAIGGMAIPDFGGALDTRTSSQSWSRWPGASVGQVIRVVKRTGEWHDYAGYGPFGDGTFDESEKGMPVEVVAGEATITSVDGNDVTLDAELPDGDIAYRVTAATSGAAPLAGSPGFGFARVLADAQGQSMVPHFLAVDVHSDNRLLPGDEYATEHRFRADCADPEVTATLVHRAYPYGLAIERGWTLQDTPITSMTD